MKILLISTTPIRQGCIALGLPSNYYGAGWVEGIVEYLSSDNDIYMLFLYYGLTEIKKKTYQKVTYIAIPITNLSFADIGTDIMVPKYLKDIDEQIKPEIVQMFGTETPVTQLVLSVFGADRTVIHLTGLVGPYSVHFSGGLQDRDIRNRTIRDILKGGIKHNQKLFERNAILEIQAIQACKYVMGRTTWDRACVEQINKNISYYHCNEMLREEFYKKNWNYESCRKHSIFVSSSSAPLKGFHKVLDALPLILKKFPDTQVFVTGRDVIHFKSVKERLKLTSYGKLLAQKIRKYHLEKHVQFLGSLNAEEMLEQYLNANVYVLPSNIENSPNSLGEAMLVGTPCVAAYVGGVPDMLNDKQEGFLYPYDESYMLAYYVCTLFKNGELARQMGRNAHARAMKTHDRENIAKKLVDVYKKIVEKNEKDIVYAE